MNAQAYKLSVRWRSRPENAKACAERLVRMLVGLAKAHPAFARWNKQAYSRAAADRPAWAMPPDVAGLVNVFEKGRQYKDVPRVPWPELELDMLYMLGMGANRRMEHH